MYAKQKNKQKATLEDVVSVHAKTCDHVRKTNIKDVTATLAEISDGTQSTDILGSYTGNPKDKDDPVPVQDADDL